MKDKELIIELKTQNKIFRRGIIEAEISLLAIGDPPSNDPPDARICGIIARSALQRTKEARDLAGGPANPKAKYELERKIREDQS